MILSSCQQVQNVSDAITKPSARDVFERELKENDSLFARYASDYQQSKQNQLQLVLPVTINSKSDASRISILSYTIELNRGERFKIQSNRNSDSLPLIMDIFDFKNDSMVSKKPIVSNAPMSNSLALDIKNDGKYKIVLFSETKNKTDFSLDIFYRAYLQFSR